MIVIANKPITSGYVFKIHGSGYNRTSIIFNEGDKCLFEQNDKIIRISNLNDPSKWIELVEGYLDWKQDFDILEEIRNDKINDILK